MKNCPHASGLFGCNALKSSGFASSTITISESWRNKYCESGKYLQCPNLKAAREMKEDKKKGKGGRLDPPSGDSGKPAGQYSNPLSPKTSGSMKTAGKNNKKKDVNNPVHAHGGIPPHYCEKPWRSSGLRFRIIKSLFYLKPWK